MKAALEKEGQRDMWHTKAFWYLGQHSELFPEAWLLVVVASQRPLTLVASSQDVINEILLYPLNNYKNNVFTYK